MGKIIGTDIRITIEIGKKSHDEDGERFEAQFKRRVEVIGGLSNTLDVFAIEAALDSTRSEIFALNKVVIRHAEHEVDTEHIELQETAQ